MNVNPLTSIFNLRKSTPIITEDVTKSTLFKYDVVLETNWREWTPLPFIPNHFRLIKFGQICVAGFAKPIMDSKASTKYTQSNFIKDHFAALYVLNDATPLKDNSPEFTVIKDEVRDFGPPAFMQFINFLHHLNGLETLGKNLAVHCRGGAGRTGTMLACAHLFDKYKKLTIEEKLKLNFSGDLSDFIYGTKLSYSEPLEAHPFIKSTVDDLRKLEESIYGYGFSVETQEQIDSLEVFFAMLLLSDFYSDSPDLSVIIFKNIISRYDETFLEDFFEIDAEYLYTQILTIIQKNIINTSI